MSLEESRVCDDEFLRLIHDQSVSRRSLKMHSIPLQLHRPAKASNAGGGVLEIATSIETKEQGFWGTDIDVPNAHTPSHDCGDRRVLVVIIVCLTQCSRYGWWWADISLASLALQVLALYESDSVSFRGSLQSLKCVHTMPP